MYICRVTRQLQAIPPWYGLIWSGCWGSEFPQPARPMIWYDLIGLDRSCKRTYKWLEIGNVAMDSYYVAAVKGSCKRSREGAGGAPYHVGGGADRISNAHGLTKHDHHAGGNLMVALQTETMKQKQDQIFKKSIHCMHQKQGTLESLQWHRFCNLLAPLPSDRNKSRLALLPQILENE